MTTIRDIVEDAFDELEIKAAEVALTDSEIAVGIRRLNRLMVTFAAGGLNVGYTKAVDIDDEFTAPDWFEEAAITHLALRLAPGFGITVQPVLAAAAQYAMLLVDRRLIQLSAPVLPNTLPIGSGNYQGDNTRFFHEDISDDLHTGAGVGIADDESIQISTN